MTSIIKEIRKEKKITQEAFAKLIGVSRPTLAKIEDGKAEPKQSEIKKICEILEIPIDDFINNRLPSKIEINVIDQKKTEIRRKNNIRIDVPQEKINKFKEVLLYILNKIGAKPNIGQTVLYKLLYFIDFDYYEKFEEQLIGAVYIKNHYGPTPVAFAKIIEDMKKDDDLEQVRSKYFKYDQIKYLPHRTADLSEFSGWEIKHIDEVIDRLGDKTAKELSDLSHKDVPWIIAGEQEPIEYESVFYRTNDTSIREYKE